MDVRERILQAALSVVFDAGVGALTQTRVARAAGVRQGHLTYYFPTRAAMLQAVVQYMMDCLMQSIAADLERGGGDAEALAKGLSRGIADPRRARLMLAMVVASDEDPAMKAWLRSFVTGLRRNLARLLETAGLDGSRAAAVHMMLVGAAILNVARDDAGSRREARVAVRVALQAFAGSSVKSTRRKGV